MRYSPSHYAEALYEALEQKTGQEYKTIVKNFLTVLQKNKDYKILPLILARYEKIYLKKHDLRKVEVTSASILPQEIEQEIKKIMGEQVVLSKKVQHDLLAGLTILVDDTIYIDASGKRKLARLFS